MKDHKIETVSAWNTLPCLSGYDAYASDFSFSGNCLYEFERSVIAYFDDSKKEVLDILKKAKDEAKSKGYKEPFVEFTNAELQCYYDDAEFKPAVLHIKAYRPMTDKERAVGLKASKAAKKAKKERADKERAKDLETLAKLKKKYE